MLAICTRFVIASTLFLSGCSFYPKEPCVPTIAITPPELMLVAGSSTRVVATIGSSGGRSRCIPRDRSVEFSARDVNGSVGTTVIQVSQVDDSVASVMGLAPGTASVLAASRENPALWTRYPVTVTSPVGLTRNRRASRP
jgi:hypothetical protein